MFDIIYNGNDVPFLVVFGPVRVAHEVCGCIICNDVGGGLSFSLFSVGVRRSGFGGEGKSMVAVLSHMGRQWKLRLLLSLLLVVVIWDRLSWAGSVAERFASGDEGGSVAAGSVRMGEIAVAAFVLVMVACCGEKTDGIKPVK